MNARPPLHRTWFATAALLAAVTAGCASSNSPPVGADDAGSGSGGATTPGSGGASAGSGGSTLGGSGGATGSGGASGSGGSVAPGSGGTSGGSGGATGNDGGGNGDTASTGNGCTGVQSTFCEDFDKQTAGGKPTGTFTVVGTMVVDKTRAYSGTQSVYIHLNNPGGDTTAQMRFQGAPLFPALADGIYGRAMVYMTAVPGCCSTSNGIHWDLTTAKSGGTEYTLGSMYGNFMPVYQPGDDSVDTKTKWPEKKWACIQWQFSGTANMLDVKVDGVRAAPGIPVTKWKFAKWNYLDFGWINFQPSTIPVDMWIDDLAIGSAEIPCPAGPASVP